MKNIFKSKRNILIMMFALVVIMGIGFAAYSQQLEIKDTSSIDSNWNVYIKSVDPKVSDEWVTGSGKVDKATNVKADLTTDLKYPGDNVIYKITVANDGTIDAVLEKINFSMEKEGTVIKYYYSVDDQVTWNEVAAEQKENSYNEDLLAKTTDDFYVKVEYDPTKTGTATEEEKSNKLTLEFIYTQKTGGGAIIPDNTVSFGGQTVTLAEAGEDGLYKDEYEDERYIYKGLNPDNYITFNNEPWRILSIEKDGTLKIAKKDNIGRRTFDSRGYRDNTSNGTGGTYCVQGSSGCNAWTVSDNFVNVSKIGTVLKDAELNTYLNNEYLRTINEDSKYIINHDFNIGAPGDSSNTDDIATDISQEALYKWNGKIGLINVTDILRTTTSTDCTSLSVAYNNGSKSVCSNNNWMWPQSGWLWTITPHLNITTNIRIVGGNGYISSTYSVDGGISVLPVLYLTSDIILSGEGTIDDPYTINS